MNKFVLCFYQIIDLLYDYPISTMSFNIANVVAN